MNKSILIIKQTNFTTHDYKLLSINNYIKLGYTINIFDLTPLFYKKYESINNNSINYFLINEYLEFKEKFEKIRPDFVFSLINPSVDSFFIKFKILNFIKRKCIIIDFRSINLPYHTNLFTKIKILIKYLIFSPWIIVKPHYSYITNIKSRYYLSGKPIFGHEFDFDSYLLSKSNDIKNFKFNYILFLDEDNVFHTDFIYLDKKSPFTEDIYFYEVNKMLDYLKKYYNLNILVQLHPRANPNISKLFYKHQLSNLRTADAIKNASIVVSHCSTALQFAVLFKKPIILMKVSQMTPIYLNLIYNFSRLLKTKVISYNDCNLIVDELLIDNKLYEKYKDTYIKYPNSPYLFSYEIIINNLNIIK